MGRELFDVMARCGLIRRGRVAVSNISRLPATKLIDVTRELAYLTAVPPEQRGSLLRHTASLPLGGGREHCRNVPCRIRTGAELVQFALLYSDEVYISSYFAGHSYEPDVIDSNLDGARVDLIGDVRILLALRPAVEAGYIRLYSPPAVDCPQCLANETFGTNADKRLRKAARRLSKRFLEEVDVDIFKDESEWITNFSGPEELLGHKGSLVSLGPPDSLEEHPGIARRVAEGELVRLSKRLRQRLGIHNYLADEVIRSVAFDMLASQHLGTSLLTAWSSEVEVLNAVSQDSGIEARNKMALDNMTSLVPFLKDAPASAILRLRQRENEAFLRYRAALNAALSEYKVENKLSTRRAKQIYGDIIEPKLAELDQKFKYARRTLARELRHDVIAWVGAISFGVYSGLLPATVAAAAKGVGMTALVATLLSKAMRNPADNLRDDQYYFLWRVRQERNPRGTA